MKNASLRPLAFLTAGLLCSGSSALAAIVFQADFNDSTSAGLVSLGGTGALRTSTSFTATVATSDSWYSGGYLRIVNPKTATSGASSAITLTPSSSASSWAAFHTGGNTSILNGGSDFFVRVASIDSTRANSWFRPIDFGSTTSGGLRLILESQGTDQLRLQIQSPANGLIRENSTTASVLTATGTFSFDQGDIAHIGFTFSTDANGWITMNLFAAKTTGAIDTASTADRIASLTFKIDQSIVTSGFGSGAFYLNGGYLAGTENTLDFDSFRLYDAVPASFSGIPEPSLASAIIGGAALIAVTVRRKR